MEKCGASAGCMVKLDKSVNPCWRDRTFLFILNSFEFDWPIYRMPFFDSIFFTCSTYFWSNGLPSALDSATGLAFGEMSISPAGSKDLQNCQCSQPSFPSQSALFSRIAFALATAKPPKAD